MLLDEIQNVCIWDQKILCVPLAREDKKINMQWRDIVEMDCIFRRCEKLNLSFPRRLHDDRYRHGSYSSDGTMES